MKFLIKGKEILQRSGLENPHRLAMHSQISYPTADKYINHPEAIKSIDAGILASILLNGLKLSPDQVLDMRLGDIFEIVEGD